MEKMGEPATHLGQALGTPMRGWPARPGPPHTPMAGRYCTLEKLDPERHAADLHAANSEDAEGRIWTYLAYGPFASLDAYRGWAEPSSRGEDPLFHAIVDMRSGRAVGVASYLRIDPPAGV